MFRFESQLWGARLERAAASAERARELVAQGEAAHDDLVQQRGWSVLGMWAETCEDQTEYTARATRPGWTIGVGGEYAFTRILSGFIEYNYYDFGTRQITFTPQVIGLNPAFVDIKDTTSVVRAGLNVRFGGYAANY